jgi:AcrR family transcriptional regulator
MGRTKRIGDEVLLAAARGVFAEQGYGASTRDIARRAGVSEAVLYLRHPTKLDLFFAAMVPPPVDAFPPRAAGGSFEPALRSVAVAMLDYFRRAMPVLMQLVVHPAFNARDMVERGAGVPLHALAGQLDAWLDDRRRKGDIGADRPARRAAALVLLATLHSVALFERMGLHGGTVSDGALRDVVRLIAAGLDVRPG